MLVVQLYGAMRLLRFRSNVVGTIIYNIRVSYFCGSECLCSIKPALNCASSEVYWPELRADTLSATVRGAPEQHPDCYPLLRLKLSGAC
jgi:hypothetical protein